MSESGVIPHHGPREIGRMKDADGVPIVFLVTDYGVVRVAVRVSGGDPDDLRMGSDSYAMADLDHRARAQFSRLYFEAGRQAEASSG